MRGTPRWIVTASLGLALQACSWPWDAFTDASGASRDVPGSDASDAADDLVRDAPVDTTTGDAPDSTDLDAIDGIDTGPSSCDAGATRSCYSGPAMTSGVGACHAGTQSCVSGSWETSCTSEITPAPAETCDNAIDDDCNGVVDDGCILQGGQTSCPTSGTTPGCGVVRATPGTFDLGDTIAVTEGGTPIQPSVALTARLAIDAYEVSVARFRAYWTTANHPSANRTVLYPGGTTLTLPSTTATVPLATGSAMMGCNWSTTPGTRESHPINCVDWITAEAFCTWDGGRLPTEAEWEYFARGRRVGGLPLPRSYPWGNEDPMGGADAGTCDRAQWNNCAGDDGGFTRHVGSFAANAGIYDLAGNVREWVADLADAYHDGVSTMGTCWNAPPSVSNPLCGPTVDATSHRSARGGFYSIVTVGFIRSAARTEAALTDQRANLGFRCIRMF